MLFWTITKLLSTIQFVSFTQSNVRLLKDVGRNAFKARLSSMKPFVHIYPWNAYTVGKLSTGWMSSSMSKMTALAATIAWNVAWPYKRVKHSGSRTIASHRWLAILQTCLKAKIMWSKCSKRKYTGRISWYRSSCISRSCWSRGLSRWKPCSCLTIKILRPILAWMR